MRARMAPRHVSDDVAKPNHGYLCVDSAPVSREVWSASIDPVPEATVTQTPPSVSDLVARFQLRRRATSAEFAAGVRLARQGAVCLDDVTAGLVRARVRAGTVYEVRLRAAAGLIDDACACDRDDRDPCRHKVAVAHALWIRDRRSGREAPRGG